MPTDTPPTAAKAKGRPRLYREEILRVIGARDGAVSAQEIHLALRGRGERTGLSTIYRELHRLVGLRLLHAFHFADEALYQLPTTPRQDYLVCDRCHRLKAHPRAWGAPPGGAELGGFLDPEIPVVIHGQCLQCLSEGDDGKSAPAQLAAARPTRPPWTTRQSVLNPPT